MVVTAQSTVCHHLIETIKTIIDVITYSINNNGDMDVQEIAIIGTEMVATTTIKFLILIQHLKQTKRIYYVVPMYYISKGITK